mmetsp:Transcript_65176/g.146418  ORF Transcript_65176/g.146418 Transcript_65176/m.146418 type:complete len:392 (+) Transcript_65176:98-1273(+)
MGQSAALCKSERCNPERLKVLVVPCEEASAEDDSPPEEEVHGPPAGEAAPQSSDDSRGNQGSSGARGPFRTRPAVAAAAPSRGKSCGWLCRPGGAERGATLQVEAGRRELEDWLRTEIGQRRRQRHQLGGHLPHPSEVMKWKESRERAMMEADRLRRLAEHAASSAASQVGLFPSSAEASSLLQPGEEGQAWRSRVRPQRKAAEDPEVISSEGGQDAFCLPRMPAAAAVMRRRPLMMLRLDYEAPLPTAMGTEPAPPQPAQPDAPDETELNIAVAAAANTAEVEAMGEAMVDAKAEEAKEAEEAEEAHDVEEAQEIEAEEAEELAPRCRSRGPPSSRRPPPATGGAGPDFSAAPTFKMDWGIHGGADTAGTGGTAAEDFSSCDWAETPRPI